MPAQFQSEYDHIQAEVGTFAADSGPAPSNPSTTVGTELLDANGNIGSKLLAASAIANVTAELNAFAALGVQGVTVDVSFPLLLPTTPDSSGYLSFYEQVATQVRVHDMVLSVEENPVFSNTPLTSLSISYAGLNLATYATEQREQAQMIIDDLHPTYLTLLDEPDTFTEALKIDLNSPGLSVEVVNDELQGLDRGRTLVGAGTGTWSAPAIDQALVADTGIDYLDVHVYPLGPTPVANLETDVQAAKTAQKMLVMDETWLNKPAGSGQAAGLQGAPQELKLKSYSFWEPLDEKYLEDMTGYVRAQGFSYVSFFDGAKASFAYLTWSPQLQDASYQAFSRQYNAVIDQNMRDLMVSGTGLALHQVIEGT